MRSLSGWGGGMLVGRWGREATAEALGEAAAAIAAGQEAETCVVGHDGAGFMVEEIAGSVAGALAERGVEVTNLEGPAPPPLVSLACRERGAPLGLAVSACGRGWDRAGLKAFGQGGSPLTPEIPEGGAPAPKPTPAGSSSAAGAASRMVEAIRSGGRPRRPRKLLVDLGHGATREVMAELLEADSVVWRSGERRPAALGGGLRGGSDALRDAAREASSGGHEAAVILDEGAERFALLDENGDLVPNALAQALVLRALVKGRRRTGPLICALDTSASLTEAAGRLGVPCAYTTTRDADLWRALERRGGVMAAKRGNVTIMPEGAPSGDAFGALALLLEAWDESGVPLSELVADAEDKVGRRFARTVRLQLDPVTYERVVDRFREEPVMELGGHPLSGVRDLEGIRTDYADGSWFLATFAGEGALEITMEGRSAARAREMEAQLLAWAGL